VPVIQRMMAIDRPPSLPLPFPFLTCHSLNQFTWCGLLFVDILYRANTGANAGYRPSHGHPAI
jgi:hypothetical protein